MSRSMYVNLPVKDLQRSIAFFTALGFKFNPQFTDENATCMIVGQDCFVMLLVEPFFKGFIKKEISDAKKTTEVIIALTARDRQDVDNILKIATTEGGKAAGETLDHGWMYNRSFEDLDGHLWEVVFMDMANMPQG
jgi:uncharacterized protein